VRNNKIFDNKKAGVVVSHDGRGTFEGNEIFRNAGGGFNIQQREAPVMKDNNVHDNEAGKGRVRGEGERRKGRD
jgi:parallel beta-helix repeat protein